MTVDPSTFAGSGDDYPAATPPAIRQSIWSSDVAIPVYLALATLTHLQLVCKSA